VDLIYAIPWVVGALLLHEVPNSTTLILAPVLIASWWQDWLSARAAASYFSGELVGFDLLTAGNYIGLVDSWRRDVPAGGLVSTELLVHWTGIFIIYIAWNLVIIRKADPATRSAFIKFSVAETPVAIVGSLLVVGQVGVWAQPSWVQPLGVTALAIAHVTLLVTWRIMSRKEQ
jgi:hypothetical protein